MLDRRTELANHMLPFATSAAVVLREVVEAAEAKAEQVKSLDSRRDLHAFAEELRAVWEHFLEVSA